MVYMGPDTCLQVLGGSISCAPHTYQVLVFLPQLQKVRCTEYNIPEARHSQEDLTVSLLWDDYVLLLAHS